MLQVGRSTTHVLNSRRCNSKTTDVLKRMFRRLADASPVMTKGNFQELETRLGWNFCPKGMLHHHMWGELVCPVRHGLFDPMHIFFTGGVFNTHVALLIKVIKSCGYDQKFLDGYLSKWNPPKAFQSLWIKDVFDERMYANHIREATLKATASECLSVLPVLACLMEEALGSGLDPSMNKHAACFLQLAQIIETIFRSSKHVVDAPSLCRCIEKCLQLFKELYG